MFYVVVHFFLIVKSPKSFQSNQQTVVAFIHLSLCYPLLPVSKRKISCASLVGVCLMFKKTNTSNPRNVQVNLTALLQPVEKVKATCVDHAMACDVNVGKPSCENKYNLGNCLPSCNRSVFFLRKQCKSDCSGYLC